MLAKVGPDIPRSLFRQPVRRAIRLWLAQQKVSPANAEEQCHGHDSFRRIHHRSPDTRALKTANPTRIVLAGARQSKTACLSLHGNGDGLGELKRQLTLGREGGYVLCVRLALGLSTVFGIVFGLVFCGLRHRVGLQLVGFSV